MTRELSEPPRSLSPMAARRRRLHRLHGCNSDDVVHVDARLVLVGPDVEGTRKLSTPRITSASGREIAGRSTPRGDKEDVLRILDIPVILPADRRRRRWDKVAHDVRGMSTIYGWLAYRENDHRKLPTSSPPPHPRASSARGNYRSRTRVAAASTLARVSALTHQEFRAVSKLSCRRAAWTRRA